MYCAEIVSVINVLTSRKWVVEWCFMSLLKVQLVHLWIEIIVGWVPSAASHRLGTHVLHFGLRWLIGFVSHRGAVAVDPLLGNGAIGAGIAGVGSAGLLERNSSKELREGGG